MVMYKIANYNFQPESEKKNAFKTWFYVEGGYSEKKSSLYRTINPPSLALCIFSF